MRTDYKDFIASTENRHYRQIDNDDGTISLVDETVYTQEGDKVSAGVLNELSQNAIWPLQYAKSGTVHQLTGLTAVSGIVSCVFTATADFAEGDTLTVDGEEYVVQMPDGEAAPDSLFTSGVSVSVVVDKTGKKVNFKSAGGVKLPAGTWVIVKAYTSVFDNIIDEDFVAPVSGKYRVTVIGEGGDGENSYSNAGDSRSGGGGGSGGWASSILTLTKGQKIPITCASAISSFGNYLSAISGKAASGKNGGAAGTASGGNEHNFRGIKGKAGKEGLDTYSYAGGSGAKVSNPSLSKFLSTASGAGGSTYSGGTNNGGTPISEGAFNCFGAGGGGGAFLPMIYEFSGGEGGPGGVIIELLLEGVNDT